MLNLLSTLLGGATAKAAETPTDYVAADLLNQKIRDAEDGETNLKRTLASMIMRQRVEQTALDLLRVRKAALESRVRQALAAQSEDLAMNGATSIADIENEEVDRAATVDRLNDKVQRLRAAVEKAQRRLLDLRQGALSARAPHPGADQTPDSDAGVTEEDSADPAVSRTASVHPDDVLARLRPARS